MLAKQCRDQLGARALTLSWRACYENSAECLAVESVSRLGTRRPINRMERRSCRSSNGSRARLCRASDRREQSESFRLSAGMARLPPLSLTQRLERVRDIAGDLSRELVRNCGDCPATRAMAEQLRDDAEAVLRLVKRP